MALSYFTLTGTFLLPNGSVPGAGSSLVLTPINRATNNSIVVPAAGVTINLSSGSIPAGSQFAASVAFYCQEQISGVNPTPSPYIIPAQVSGASVDLSTISTATALPYYPAYMGTWSSSQSYQPGQVVYYEGASYVAILGSTNVVPTSSTSYWGILSGVTGTSGSASVSSAASVSISHGLGTAPAIGNITVTPEFNTGAIWVNNITSSTFQISWVTAGSGLIGWSAFL